MRKTIRKRFWVWDFDKEEKWLNDMSAKGLQLCDVGFSKYVFEEGLPGEYVYRLELLDNSPNHTESVQYIRFIEDTGAEQIGSLMRWVYFRKRAGGNGFNLFSDIDSRIAHLNRILLLVGILSGLNLFNGVNQISYWFSSGRLFSLITGILCLAIGVLIGYGFIHIFLKKRKLKKEKILRE